MEALRQRYGRIEDETAGVVEEELYVVGKGKQTTVEMVGAKSVNIKQRYGNPFIEVGVKIRSTVGRRPHRIQIYNFDEKSPT